MVQLGLLADLSGSWEGHGFNLVARPDSGDGDQPFVELNQTKESLKFHPLSSPVPSRGTEQTVELSGLTYLQSITDVVTGCGLHIEPGIWVTDASTLPPTGKSHSAKQKIQRMASIPHGNSLLMGGWATSIQPAPDKSFEIAPVNVAPFPADAPMPAAIVGGRLPNYPPYDLSDFSKSAVGFRTAVDDRLTMHGIPIQTIVNDPTRLLQAVVSGQPIAKIVMISMSTASVIDNFERPPAGLAGDLGIDTLTIYGDQLAAFANFWLETINHGSNSFLQLQYAQTVILSFPTQGKK